MNMSFKGNSACNISLINAPVSNLYNNKANADPAQQISKQQGLRLNINSYFKNKLMSFR